MPETAPGSLDLANLTSIIVAAYLTKHRVSQGEVAPLISLVHSALDNLGRPTPEPLEKVKPAVSIRKSVTPDYLISLEDGRQYKSLKRHLNVRGMTPEDYRAKWELPSDYPMVAENYAKLRSEMAKSLGLGRKAAAPPPPPPPAKAASAKRVAKAKPARAPKAKA